MRLGAQLVRFIAEVFAHERLRTLVRVRFWCRDTTSRRLTTEYII